MSNSPWKSKRRLRISAALTLSVVAFLCIGLSIGVLIEGGSILQYFFGYRLRFLEILMMAGVFFLVFLYAGFSEEDKK
jgi:hypothetical protein